MRKNSMGHRKASYIIVLFLLMGIWTNSVTSEACLCGQACRHSLQSKLEAGVNSFFHMRCCGTNCNSCNIEKGQSLKAANTFKTTGNLQVLDRTPTISMFVDYPATSHTIKDFGVFYTCRAILSAQIYLKNLSLLC
jgi:hypothetical protein